jgi:4-amino-4-deoxy-L-arabinose transferase-like glycosyltransferase
MAVERPNGRRAEIATLLLIVLLGLALRLYRIDHQSLWNDEGTSVALAARDLASITRGAANDIHPPLYYYLLHGWIALFGTSEVVVRSLSALLGTGVVWLTFALGRHVWRRDGATRVPNWVALTAALIAALSPFQICYSQETRMYMLTTFLGALSMLCFLHLLPGWGKDRAPPNSKGPVGEHWLAAVTYVIVTMLLLYSHYFAVTLLLAQHLVFLWWLREQRDYDRQRALRATWRWVATQALIAASYAPWLFVVRKRLQSWPAISHPLRLTEWIPDLLRTFGLGLPGASLPSLTWAGFAVLLLLGAIAACLVRPEPIPNNRNSPSPCLITLLYLLVPIVVMYALSLRRPMYDPKFLLLSTPAFHLLLGQGAVFLALGGRAAVRRLRGQGNGTNAIRAGSGLLAVAAVGFVTLTSYASLRQYYFNPGYARDDYRGIARYIEALEHRRDAILINAPGQIETLTYYYQGDLQLYPLPRQRPLDRKQTQADLEEMVAGRRHIYAVLWATDESDPERFVEGWLDQHAYKATDSWHGNVRLVIYAVPVEPLGESVEYPLDVNLGNKVQLVGYNLPASQVLPGDILQLTLFWQAITPMGERYKVFTHVLDAHGHLVGQRDAEPGGGAKITTHWQEGEQIIDNYGLPILPGTPPGEYRIEIGMYGLDDGQRLPVIEDSEPVGDHVILQSVQIAPAPAPPPASVLDMDARLHLSFGDLTLLGLRLVKLGFAHQPDAPLRGGDVAHLTLFWRADRPSSEDLLLQLSLQDQEGRTWLEHPTPITSGQYRASSWRVGETIRDQHNLPLPPDLPPGRYRLTVAAEGLHSGQPVGAPQMLTELNISD